MIEIVPYREAWPAEFRAVGDRIREALGPLALAIHHIGSTAVTGMPAKDVIDVQLTVASLEDLIEPQLNSIGYELTSFSVDHAPFGLQTVPREMEKRYYRAPSAARVHLHVRSVDRLNRRYALICRDYLRSHPMAAAAYAEIKLQLAKRFAEDVDSYYDIKDPVFDIIMSGGFEWAEISDWSPPPTDA
jgi:GrpB-like predicted nucleotidyltransferase (UPF0157 family)